MNDIIKFMNRIDAGKQLAFRLKNYKDKEGIIIIALPKGGVIIGHEIASFLNCPLDVIIIRKLGFPGNPEFAIGAISENMSIFLDENMISSHGISEEYIREEIDRQKVLIERRVNLYRKGKTLTDLRGKIVILVDDGIATGATVFVAVEWIKKQKPKRIIVAIPVGPRDTIERLSKIAEVVVLYDPIMFGAVGEFYHSFDQVEDYQVAEIMSSYQHEPKGSK